MMLIEDGSSEITIRMRVEWNKQFDLFKAIFLDQQQMQNWFFFVISCFPSNVKRAVRKHSIYHRKINSLEEVIEFV